MEENKFDPYQFIGFILIAIILTWMLYDQQPITDENSKVENSLNVPTQSPVNNKTVKPFEKIQDFGEFKSLFEEEINSKSILIENGKMILKVQSKGGMINELKLKNFTNHKGDSLYIINDNNDFNIQFTSIDGRVFNSSDFYFKPIFSRKNSKQVLTMKASISRDKYLAFIYEFQPDDFMINFKIESGGFKSILNSRESIKLNWDLKCFRNSKSVEYENRYTELTYGYEDNKMSYLSSTSSDDEEVNEINWIGYKQHFFNSILIPEKQLKKVNFKSDNLVASEDKNQLYTKKYFTYFEFQNPNEINLKFKWYFGPSEYEVLKSYDLGIEDSIYFGWGIFGWINKYVFIKLFNFLSSFFPYGISIIVMTILVRLAMSPVTYKSYVSQVKMKALRPEVDQINSKYKDDAVKRQQETMSLYNQAGANPMSGCLPALLQLPVFYALFSFFPVAFALRQKSFLWADDLSSYDSILDLPFNIPLYGDHISLFPILASIAIFFYTMMTMGQQPTANQPGMPNMKVIMYLMPLMMLFFFNNYASGLSLYYFVSNILTIILMLVIKNFIIDDEKIRLQIEENKKRPKKKGGFSARLQKAMEQAEKQKKLQNKRR
ncbi:MAG: membrane protein insertase YidC [Flavobacteriaceae bacterium]|nr:membrane protein insertase YidC [Flavobacteriaceae bacterium]